MAGPPFWGLSARSRTEIGLSDGCVQRNQRKQSEPGGRLIAAGQACLTNASRGGMVFKRAGYAVSRTGRGGKVGRRVTSEAV